MDPQTGQSCNSLPLERVVVRRIAAAYQLEQQAIQSPTTVRNSVTSSPSATTGRSASSNLSQVEALSRALGIRQSSDSGTLPNGLAAENDCDAQNMQSRKEAFPTGACTGQTDNNLRSTREAPLSRYEIKAGWEIPAVLEQSLNSDLPGELNALVTSNVDDTATGLYVLIPQGIPPQPAAYTVTTTRPRRTGCSTSSCARAISASGMRSPISNPAHPA
jgi:type IV secretory pathway VirB10-like protein